ncbi:MAG: hypothetical protein ACXABO_01395 [Promethearchaeota archaeon]|jgi:t-SNARE complex subunit (syntaxin)
MIDSEVDELRKGRNKKIYLGIIGISAIAFIIVIFSIIALGAVPVSS